MIHQYINNGFYIVLDVNSGSVHVVDKIVYDVIPLFEQYKKEEIVEQLKEHYNKEQILEAYQEVLELKEQGQLFTEDN